jgi:hypothetical protein
VKLFGREYRGKHHREVKSNFIFMGASIYVSPAINAVGKICNWMRTSCFIFANDLYYVYSFERVNIEDG